MCIGVLIVIHLQTYTKLPVSFAGTSSKVHTSVGERRFIVGKRKEAGTKINVFARILYKDTQGYLTN